MSKHTINITGVQSPIKPQSTPPNRQAIFNVVNDTKSFSLLVQALTLMQAADQNQAASHFQIGGIHGQPYVEWDGAGSAKSVSQEWEGYCTHGTVAFPTWHRPYVALYEQVLQGYAVQIADTYTTADKAQWQTTAANFRLPYWDWASNSVPPAQVLSQQQVSIQVADGSTKTVQNPLFSYQFHPVSQGQFGTPYRNWQSTLRCPTSTGASAKSSPTQVASNLTGNNGTIAYQLKHSTYILLTQIDNWLNMSNHSSDINTDYASSLEAIHDKIHGYVGGDRGGHMSDPEVAGHDPIFFMHHANVDRILALWQAINYDTFVPSSTAEEGSFMWAAGSTIDETTPLAPFWKDANSFWTSDGSRDFTTFGYSYPEFAGLNLSDKEAVKQAITAKVNTLYGQAFIRPRPRIFSALSSKLPSLATAFAQTPAKTSPSPAPQATSTGTAPIAAFVAQSPAGHPAAPASNSEAEPKAVIEQSNPGPEDDEHLMVDWRVRVLTPKYKLNGPYSVLVFLGPVPPNSEAAEWRNAKTLIGSVEVFANGNPNACANCRIHQDLTLEGVVYLNHALSMSDLPSFEPGVVAPFLRDNLHWRVIKNAEAVDIPRDIPELKVSVVEVPIHFAPGDAVPRRVGDVNHHPMITTGRVGGAS